MDYTIPTCYGILNIEVSPGGHDSALSLCSIMPKKHSLKSDFSQILNSRNIHSKSHILPPLLLPLSCCIDFPTLPSSSTFSFLDFLSLSGSVKSCSAL